MTNKDVAEGFLNGLALSTNSFHSTVDGRLFSYSTCIAQFWDNKLIGNSTKYSVTTSKHLNYIKNKIHLWTSPNKPVPTGTRDLIPYLDL